jgi:hypothetical protein
LIRAQIERGRELRAIDYQRCHRRDRSDPREFVEILNNATTLF